MYSTMTSVMNTHRKILLYIWIFVVTSTFCLFLFREDIVRTTLSSLLSGSSPSAYILLFVLGALRGFTLLPSTLLIVAGLLFIPALPLFFIILSGIIISSLSVYYFFEYLKLDTLCNTKHRKFLDKGRVYLNKYELPVIIFWSMAPMLPTDVICYLSGTLRVNVYKFILGIVIGESILCAIYIWGGKAILEMF